MREFAKDDVTLHFDDSGHGFPVILLHGFGMTADAAWGGRGWYDLLGDQGFRAIALDSRGHGRSSALTDPSRYDAGAMMDDVIRLLDHLRIERAFFIGHSMGARTVLNLAVECTERVAAAALVSLGENAFASPDTRALRDALLTNDRSALPPARAQFIEMLLSNGNDRAALAAYCANPRPAMTAEYFRPIKAPICVVCGTNDSIVGDAGKLASAITDADFRLIDGKEHTDILGSQELKALLVSFLQAQTGQL